MLIQLTHRHRQSSLLGSSPPPPVEANGLVQSRCTPTQTSWISGLVMSPGRCQVRVWVAKQRYSGELVAYVDELNHFHIMYAFGHLCNGLSSFMASPSPFLSSQMPSHLLPRSPSAPISIAFSISNCRSPPSKNEIKSQSLASNILPLTHSSSQTPHTAPCVPRPILSPPQRPLSRPPRPVAQTTCKSPVSPSPMLPPRPQNSPPPHS